MVNLEIKVIINNYDTHDYAILYQNNNCDLSKTLAEIGIYLQEEIENGNDVKILIEKEV